MLELGKEQTIAVGAKTWRLGKLSVAAIRGFRAWIKERLGDPFAKVERVLPLLSKEDGLVRIKEAEAIAEQLESFSMQTPLAKRFMQSEEGIAVLFHQLMLPAHPDATVDDAMALLAELGEEKKAEVLAKAEGSLPNAEAGALAVPVYPALLTGTPSTDTSGSVSPASRPRKSKR
jgi:hypothetical protein